MNSNTGRRLIRSDAAPAALALAWLAVLPAAAAAQPAQDWCRESRVRRDEFCEVRELALHSQNNRVTVDVTPNGSITVQGYDGPTVRVTARVVARSGRDPEALAADVQIVTRDGEIRATGPRRVGRDSWTVSVRMQVPVGTELDLRTTNGSITTARTNARVQARTTNGAIRLEDVAGSMNARSTNGSIRAAFAPGSRVQQDMELRTTNGSVHLQVPDGASARLTASTTNGRINTDVPISIQGTVSRRRVTGVIGDGGPEITVRTTNGGIRITRGPS